MKQHSEELTSAPLFDHLEELRLRIIYSLGFLLLGTVVAYSYRMELIEWVKKPLSASELYREGVVRVVTLALTDQFMLSLSLSLWAGFALSLPFLLGQVWGFISPGLYKEERRWALPFILGAGFAFISGAAFGYFFVLPAMVAFLLDFLGGTVTPQLNLRDYIGTVVTFLVSFGLSFEMPIVALILTRMGLVNHVMLRSVWRFALIGIMILAAIITPTPDPANMLLVSVPLYLLYELSILLARLFALPPLEDDSP